ncbi:MAG: hypothetical protein Q4D82_07980 [Neisseria sp.]|nr:hypothetical protein [Neisseria sp.]
MKQGKLGKVTINGKTVTGISAAATNENGEKGSYKLGLFGKKAEELAGSGKIGNESFGFGGKQGEMIDGTENARRKAVEKDLNKKALDAGLPAEQAKRYAADFKLAEEAVAAAELDKLVKEKHYQDGLVAAEKAKVDLVAETKAAKINLVEYPVKDELQHVSDYSEWNGNEIPDEQGRIIQIDKSGKLYNQPFSMVLNTNISKFVTENGKLSVEETYPLEITGYATPEKSLPMVGRAEYAGYAIKVPYQANFRYVVDFGKRTGSGVIQDLGDYRSMGVINLAEGKIGRYRLNNLDVVGISSLATGTNDEDLRNGRYTLGFFGSEAQEVAGIVSFEDHRNWVKSKNYEVGFGGKRGEIQK